MTSKKSYEKFHVKRDPQTLEFLVKGKEGEAKKASALKEGEKFETIPGEKIRNCRITDEMAEELNEISLKNGYMYVPGKEEKPKKEESKGDDPEQAEKDALWARINDFKDKGLIEQLPHPATGVPKLTALIEKVEKGEE